MLRGECYTSRGLWAGSCGRTASWTRCKRVTNRLTAACTGFHSVGVTGRAACHFLIPKAVHPCLEAAVVLHLCRKGAW